MRKSRSFTASGFDALEGRVVMSHVPAAAAAGVIHGHKAQLVAADFANFQTSLNSTITPLVKDMQNTATPADQAYSDGQQINTTITNMVNDLGNQLAKQLHKKMYARIRSVVTGASSPGPVGFAASSPSASSLLATLDSLSQADLATPGLVNNLVAVYQDAMISGHTAKVVSSDFVGFERSFNKTIAPLVEKLQTATPDQVAQDQQALDTAIVSLVNGLANQLSTDLGTTAQPTIRTLITGQSSPTGISFTSGTPIAGSLLATLESAPSTELTNWDFVGDLVSVYSSSSPVWK